jgi:hypothetical protein
LVYELLGDVAVAAWAVEMVDVFESKPIIKP